MMKQKLVILVNFLLNGITTLNLLKLNKSSHKVILGYANTLIKTVKVLN